MDLYQEFVDLRKIQLLALVSGAFSKLGCTPHFFRILKFIIVDLEVSVSVADVLTDPHKGENRQKAARPLSFNTIFILFCNGPA